MSCYALIPLRLIPSCWGGISRQYYGSKVSSGEPIYKEVLAIFIDCKNNEVAPLGRAPASLSERRPCQVFHPGWGLRGRLAERRKIHELYGAARDSIRTNLREAKMQKNMGVIVVALFLTGIIIAVGDRLLNRQVATRRTLPHPGRDLPSMFPPQSCLTTTIGMRLPPIHSTRGGRCASRESLTASTKMQWRRFICCLRTAMMSSWEWKQS